ncbi:PLP-dependent transferase [Metschnikowia bicuspidata var. bicuspidata NRRL YB-4993]|uniref:serine C-palmitoyltransferase n=1 Tax=Metschnikowia bicuspidata var. bicuspidata NRRL YB-4993 TaxID=869754 RepID=A0A1A0HDJ8_9ASCO|nr:PLP-dependent transferase [Metschnikowia bicuspidata var. bicuspidata NRRL YB-4993]OBA22050.1 PLP-dependent transferase [Metschnikowia bicuspidata var. bicuspidata NRRL YB-4993]
MTAQSEVSSLPPSLDFLEAKLGLKVTYCLALLENVPGGLIVSRYIKSSYKDDPLRSLFEFALFIFAVHYFLSSKKKENKAEIVTFSQKEIDELIDEWDPAPLVDPVSDLEHWQLKEYHVKGENSSHVELVGHPELSKVVNMSSLDFLDLNCSTRLKKAAKDAISNSGVGACGPPNFYGSQDVHVRLEEDLSRYLQTEQAILYGQDFVTAGSVIPAFLKRGDLAVVDSGINVAIQKALIVSRCDIEWYDHNDVEHLEQILSELDPILNKQKPLRRRFIISEGIFAYSGDVVKLPEIVELKNKYKYRLFLDETLSIGTLGSSGRGAPEHFGISRSEISITIGSLATSFASSGGFCVGVKPMVHHQRINSTAYVFSASLPPYSAKVASEAIKVITGNTDSQGNSIVMHSLNEKIRFCHKELTKAFSKSKYFEVVSDGNGPIAHLGLKANYRARLGLPELYGNGTLLTTGKPFRKLNAFSTHYNLECYLLQKIIDVFLRQHRILINRTRLVYEQENLPVQGPHLWVHANNGLSMEELKRAVTSLPHTVDEVCRRLQTPSDLLKLEEELKTQ